MTVGLVDRLRTRTERAFLDWARSRSRPACRVLSPQLDPGPQAMGATCVFESAEIIRGGLTLIASPAFFPTASADGPPLMPGDEIALAAREIFQRVAASMLVSGVRLRETGLHTFVPEARGDLPPPLFDLAFAAGGRAALVTMEAKLRPEHVDTSPPPRPVSGTHPRSSATVTTQRRGAR